VYVEVKGRPIFTIKESSGAEVSTAVVSQTVFVKRAGA
jgi:hypothetical protein